MSEHRDPVRDALRQLRGEVRDAVTPPPAAGLRAHAIRQQRVRRMAAVAVTAAVVLAVALGGAALLQPTAAPPLPPADTPSPPVDSPSPPVDSPSPSPSPSAEELDDPITEVDWSTATIGIPPREGCPEGPVTLAPFTDAGPGGGARGPRDDYPALAFDAAKVAYGDLDGDGRAEAVLDTSCATSEEGLLSGHGAQLLVIARAGDGTLTGLDWVGPSGAAFLDWWVADGRLLIDADPWTAGPEDHFVPVPGLALAYERDGDGFTGWEPAPEYPPIVPLDSGQPGPPVRPGTVATGLGCPDAELRFDHGSYNGGTATADGATWRIPETFNQQQFLFDLNGTGDRLLVTTVECEGPDGTAGQGLAVFTRGGGGWQGVSVLAPPGDGYVPSGWGTPEGDRFWVTWSPAGGTDPDGPTWYRWNGTELQPIDR